jgi:hypothetical protein
MFQKLGLFLIILTIITQPLSFLSTTHAQDDAEDTCDDIITQALQVVGSSCAEMGRNETCYGNTQISAEFVATPDNDFENPGDIVDALNLASLTTAPLDLDQGIWGIALMQILADLPVEDDNALTLVLLGDAQLDTTTKTDDLQTFTFSSGQNETCESAPDGLLVHAPSGQRARIVVNGVELTFSSAAFLTAQPDDQMTVQVIEGNVDATVDNQTIPISAGFYSSIDLDGLTADSAPSDPEPLEFANLDFLITLAKLINQLLIDYGIIPVNPDPLPDGQAAIPPGTRIVVDVPEGFTGIAMYLGPPTADCVEPPIDDTVVPEGETGTVIAGPFLDTCNGIPYYLLYMDIGRIGWEGDRAFRPVE